MTFPAALFAFGVIWLVTIAFGLVIEFVANKFMPTAAARFGGFCFAVGFIVGRRETIFRDLNDVQSIAGAAGSITAALCLAWRVYRAYFQQEAAK